MWLVVVGVLVYAAVILVEALPKFQEVGKDPESYYAADRGVNKIMLVCTVTISVLSGLTISGFPAAVYREGIGYFHCTGGLVAALMFASMGYRLWLLGKEYGYITPGDFLRDRYESNRYAMFTSLILVLFCVPYITLQLVAIGDALETTTGSLVPYGVAIALGTIVISAHVYSGGMKSVAWLDTFHMALGLVCTWGFLIYLVTKYFPGGLSEAAKYVKDAYPALLSHPGPKGTFTWKGVLNLALSGAIATFVWPHIFVRSYIAKSVDNFKTIAWAMPLGYVFSFGPLSVIGAIIGPALVPGLKDTDKLMPILASQYASTFMSFVLALAVFSFSVSTADSLLLAASNMASCDVYKRGIKGDTVEPKKLVLVGRLVIIILMVLTIVFAIKKPVYIVDYAYKLSSPGFGMILPAVVGGLYWKRGNATGAWAGTVVGLISLLLFMFVIKPPFGFSAFVWALLINTLFYIGGSLIGRPNSAETITRFFDNVNELKEKYK